MVADRESVQHVDVPLGGGGHPAGEAARDEGQGRERPPLVEPGRRRRRGGRSMVARWSHPQIKAVVVVIVVVVSIAILPPPIPSAAAAVDKGGGAMAGGANVGRGELKRQQRQRLPLPRSTHRHRRRHRPLTGSDDGR